MPNNDNMNSGIQEPVEQLNFVPQPVPEPSKYAEFKLKRSAEEIGFMPPRKDRKKEMSKGEKTFFLVVVAVLIIIIAIGLFFILRKAKERIVEYDVNPKNVVITLKSTPSKNPTFYATFKGIKPENCIVNISKIDTSKEGVYEFVIECGSEDKYTGHARVEGGAVIYKEEVVSNLDKTITTEDFIVKCKYKECEAEFILDEGVDINAPKEEEMYVKVKTCEKGSKEKCVESDPIKLKKVAKVTESYICEKIVRSEGNKDAIIYRVSVSFNNLGRISGKLHYSYTFQTQGNNYNDERTAALEIIKNKKIPESDYSFDSVQKRIAYEYDIVPSYETKQEFIDDYMNEKLYDCTPQEIKTSE